MQNSKSWIFLRGLSREKQHWDSFTDLFEKKLNAKVHCIDLPGTGELFQQTSPDNISEIVEDLNMHSWDVTEQSWILAHSMGCLAAIEWMRKEPHRFHGAVFINTSVKSISPLFGRLTPFALLNFVKIFFYRNNPKEREALKYILNSNDSGKTENSIAKWMQIQRLRPVSVKTMWNQIKAAFMYSAQKPRYPVLILTSKGDKLVSDASSRAIAKNWNLPIQIHNWAGHDIAHDDPEWVIQQIMDWNP